MYLPVSFQIQKLAFSTTEIYLHKHLKRCNFRPNRCHRNPLQIPHYWILLAQIHYQILWQNPRYQILSQNLCLIQHCEKLGEIRYPNQQNDFFLTAQTHCQTALNPTVSFSWLTCHCPNLLQMGGRWTSSDCLPHCRICFCYQNRYQKQCVCCAAVPHHLNRCCYSWHVCTGEKKTTNPIRMLDLRNSSTIWLKKGSGILCKEHGEVLSTTKCSSSANYYKQCHFSQKHVLKLQCWRSEEQFLPIISNLEFVLIRWVVTRRNYGFWFDLSFHWRRQTFWFGLRGRKKKTRAAHSHSWLQY